MNYEIPTCPDCGGAMVVRDSRKRAVKDSDGNEYIFQLRRLRCVLCGHTHLELPDFMQAHKHYNKTVIEAVIRGECDYCAADDSTIYRWKHPK